jgi:hypothetical protein
LYMLLALASVVFLGSESLGSRDHILLSQFWDFPFRRLLRLAGSRWRYSTPPPRIVSKITPRHGPHREHPLFHCCSCLSAGCVFSVLSSFVLGSLPGNGYIRQNTIYLRMAI